MDKVTISGCRFKFHEDLNGFASYVVYNSDQSELTTVQTTLTKTSEVDEYQFSDLVLTSYISAGTYFKCKLFNSESMPSPAYSDFSEHVPISGKQILNQTIFRCLEKSFQM